jgi:tetratricopeptide (TPR) repeat protein
VVVHIIVRLSALCLVIALASSVARAAPAHDPSSASSHLERGIKLVAAGDLDGAIVELEKAYELDPRPDVCYALGQALRKNKRCDRAIVYFRRAVEQSPSEAFTRATNYQIGRCVVENPALAHEQPQDAAEVTSTPTALNLVPAEPAKVRRAWWRDPAGLAGTGLLAGAQVLASDARNSFADHQAATIVPTLRIAGGVTLAGGGALLLGSIVRYIIVARHRR